MQFDCTTPCFTIVEGETEDLHPAPGAGVSQTNVYERVEAETQLSLVLTCGVRSEPRAPTVTSCPIELSYGLHSLRITGDPVPVSPSVPLKGLGKFFAFMVTIKVECIKNV
jgi:hypothetical protein